MDDVGTNRHSHILSLRRVAADQDHDQEVQVDEEQEEQEEQEYQEDEEDGEEAEEPQPKRLELNYLTPLCLCFQMAYITHTGEGPGETPDWTSSLLKLKR